MLRRILTKLGVLAALGAIATSCASDEADKSTGTNWLECETDADCDPAGSTCDDEGYCVDEAGNRIEPPPKGGVTCEYGGKTYQPGDDFTSTDGCNGCSCNTDGTVSCDLRACADGGPGPVNCASLEQGRTAELDSIQSCTADAECGQVLTGTSCGCTRDLVARNDADTSTFYEISDQMSAAGCDLGASTCDCPAADGFACVAGVCAWNYVDTGSCEPVDAEWFCVRGRVEGGLETLSSGDDLRLEVYPGGCWSSSCTRVDVATCSVSGSGTDLTVEADFCLGSTGSDVCTDDCSGGGTASCGAGTTLTAGDYIVSLGQTSVSFSVPSTFDLGGLCSPLP